MSPLQYYSYMDLILLVSHKEYWAVVWGMKQQSSGVTSVQCTYGSILLLPQGAVETSWHLELGWLSEHTGRSTTFAEKITSPSSSRLYTTYWNNNGNCHQLCRPSNHNRQQAICFKDQQALLAKNRAEVLVAMSFG